MIPQTVAPLEPGRKYHGKPVESMLVSLGS